MSSFLTLVALAASASAYTCTDFVAAIEVTAPSYNISTPLTPFENHYQSTELNRLLTSRDASSLPSPIGKVTSVTLELNISALYCKPDHSSANTSIQVLTHGLGFDKHYWDFGGPGSQYNYIQSATDAGYATLSYDRVGNGKSTITDPYGISQAPFELAVLIALTQKLKYGTLAESVPKPSGKVLHVGHSYGSFLSNGLIATTPSLSDGVAFTGYSLNLTFQTEFVVSTLFHLAAENQPNRFGLQSSSGYSALGERTYGYLTWGDEQSNQYNFLHYPNFDPAVLKYAEANKYPFALGEVFSEALIPVVAEKFTGPVLFISGDSDQIFCGGDCHGILEPAKAAFGKAKVFETYLQPNTGHGVNLHYNATGTYSVVQDFFKANA